jgi:alkylated DNA repair dioxygenase AlkB
MLHPAYLDRAMQEALLAEIREVIRAAPLYTPTMPKSGRPFSVRMTNCGPLGWVSDRNGYRYQTLHPESGRPWPPMPALLLTAWTDLAHYDEPPEACLVNIRIGMNSISARRWCRSRSATPACFASVERPAAARHAPSVSLPETLLCSGARTD